MQDINVFLMNHAWLSIAIIILVIVLTIIELLRLKKQHSRLSPSELTHLMNKNNAIVVDIRGIEQYRQGHIIHAISLPAEEIRQRTKKIEKYRSKPIAFICSNGLESQKIAALFKKQGYNTYSLANGMRSWSEASLPIIKE